ncbi:c-type cytochrome [Aquabacterium sp.]|uniref:c-type cytochrome n=1 Tax=Aquabacterium sp. TaxID=1872578 RepID=UPI00378419E5
MNTMQSLLRAWALAGVAVLAGGCAVEWQNRQPARQLAEQAQPPGSAYTGWRVFQDKCAGCHGAAATGTSRAPDLLPALREMGPRGFVERVLERYDWGLPPPPTADARAAQVEDVLQRRSGRLVMPAWQGEPVVTAHIIDLYAWLSARADGRLGPQRPAPGS